MYRENTFKKPGRGANFRKSRRAALQIEPDVLFALMDYMQKTLMGKGTQLCSQGIANKKFNIYTSQFKNWVFACPGIPIFESVCIAHIASGYGLLRRPQIWGAGIGKIPYS